MLDRRGIKLNCVEYIYDTIQSVQYMWDKSCTLCGITECINRVFVFQIAEGFKALSSHYLENAMPVFRALQVRAEGPGVGSALLEARRRARGAHEGSEQDHLPRGPTTAERDSVIEDGREKTCVSSQ